MLATPTSTRRLALRQGLIFGVILGILLVAFSFINLGLISNVISLVLYLGFSVVAGMRTSRVTGKLGTGVITGLWTGLFAALISAIVYLIFTFANFSAYRDALVTAAKNAGTANASSIYTDSFVSVIILIGGGFILVLGILFGLLGGVIGGSIGRGRAAPPTQEYQESFFQSPPSTPAATWEETSPEEVPPTEIPPTEVPPTE